MWNRTHAPEQAQSSTPPPRRRRTAGLVAVAAVGALVLAACGGGDSNTGSTEGSGEGSGNGALSDYKENGITIGFANEKPYDYQDESGKITGEAPELARVILGNLGIKDIEFKLVDFGALIPGLKSGRFDMTAAGASITAERAEQVLYADPDYCVHEALGVKKGNPLNLSDYKSIKNNPDATLAVESGATELQYAKGVGIPEDQLLTVSNNQAMVAAVKSGRADAFSLTHTTVASLVKTSGDGKLEVLDGFDPVIDGQKKISCGGFQFSKDHEALRDAFNKELDKLQKADKVYPIVKEFGFTKEQVNSAKQYTAQDVIDATK